MSKKRKICPRCKSSRIKKNGKARGVQTYLCKKCKHHFSSQRRNKIKLIKKLWYDYVFRKQVFRELSEAYDLDQRIIRDLLNQYNPLVKQHYPRPVHVIVDATYFGQRKEGEY